MIDARAVAVALEGTHHRPRHLRRDRGTPSASGPTPRLMGLEEVTDSSGMSAATSVWEA